VSFDLSINSQRTTEEARRLLSLLGVLPDGIAHDDLGKLLPGAGAAAAATLRKVGLAFDEATRLRVLQPIREHVRARHAPQPSDLDHAVAHYGDFAERLGWQVRGAGGAKAGSRLLTERANLEAMLGLGFQQQDPRPSIRAAIALRDFIRFSGVGTPRLLEAAADAAGNVGDLGLQAQTLLALGAIARERSDLTTAQARYEEARSLFEEVGSVLGQANCHLTLGDVALQRSYPDIAQARFEQAQPLFEEVGDVLGQANCIKGLGDVALQRSDLDSAQACYEQAQPLYKEVGSVLGLASCHLGLGDVALERSDLDSAQACYEQAQPLYEEIGMWLSIGETHQRLARLVATEVERNSHIQAARAAWARISRSDLVQELDDEFGDETTNQDGR
jgi:tetratricopeptide (TPR) repeat protein